MDSNGDLLNTIDIGILNEASTIGSGNAATSLSELLNSKVSIHVPETRIMELSKLRTTFGKAGETLCVLNVETKGDLSGQIYFVLTPEEGRKIGSVLMDKNADDIDFNDIFFQSSLKEIFNILAGSFCNALAALTGFLITITPPRMRMNKPAMIVNSDDPKMENYGKEVIYIKTLFLIEKINVEGTLIFLPDSNSIKKILKQLRGQIRDDH